MSRDIDVVGWLVVVGVENDPSVQPELSILGTEWFIDVEKFLGGGWWMVGGGVGKGLNDSSVQTEPAIYDWIDTGTKWRRTDGRREGQSEI